MRSRGKAGDDFKGLPIATIVDKLREFDTDYNRGDCMFSFQTFKDKRYWILLFPFIIILLLFSFFASNYFAENPLMIVLFLFLYVTLFWGIYHLWKYVGDEKQGDI